MNTSNGQVPVAEHDEEGPAGPGRVTAKQLRELMADDAWLDDLIDSAQQGGVQLTGEGGFLPEMIKAVLERGLAAELTGHLGYEQGDPAGRGSPNSRNGFTPKTVSTEIGPVPLDVPRDRASTFEPRLVPKGQRRLGGLDEQIISLYAGGMTVRDIQAHLARTLGTELSHDTISKITDAVLDEVKAWQSRPLEELYPIMYLDAIVVKVRDGHQVRNKAAHIAVGVDMDGVKHVLGIWVQSTEGAKFWAGVCAELSNRGVKDVLIVCCDGLTGLPEAIEATWPQTTVQTCVVHLIRASMRFVSYTDRRAVVAELKKIYTGADRGRGGDGPAGVRRIGPGPEVPGVPADLAGRLGAVHPVPGVPVAGAEDHLHHERDRVLELSAAEDHQESWALPERRRGGQAAVAGDPGYRGQTSRQRAAERGIKKGRKAEGRLVEGLVTTGWKAALGGLAIAYPDRINSKIN